MCFKMKVFAFLCMCVKLREGAVLSLPAMATEAGEFANLYIYYLT